MPSVTTPAFRLLLHHPAVQALVAAAGEVETHLVGGVLRDRVLGLPLKDIDAVVASRGREIAERLAETLPARLVLLGGKEFAAYRLVAEEVDVDLWDRAGTSLHEDMARRDFTINSFALEARTGEIYDPFNGEEDLRHRLLRATTPESFAGDPLRVLRLPRLLVRLPGFSADPDTIGLARRSVPRLLKVAAERVRDELTFLLEHPEAHRGLAMLIALDVYPGLWMGTPGVPGRTGTALSEVEALPERIQELRQEDTAAADRVDGRTARLAALFRNLPLVPAEETPREALVRFRDAGYLTRQTADEVAILLEMDGLEMDGLPADEVGRRRLLHRLGALWPTALCSLGARMAVQKEGREEGIGRWRAALPAIVDLAHREGETLFDPPRLVTGADVQALLEIPPGKEIGRVLDAVRAAQVEGRVRTREEAVEVVRGWAGGDA
jgi:tRNA nucleotidyltransferase/poly(A) polymerase